MAIKPIPKHLLIHSVDYEEYTGGDGWDGTYDPPVTIEHVRVEPMKALRRTADSEGNESTHIVMVDKVNSSSFPAFKNQSKITFNGETYELAEVKTLYAFGSTPHHYELELK